MSEGRGKGRTSSQDRPIIKLKPAFTAVRRGRKAVSSRQHYLAAPSSASPADTSLPERRGRKYRVVRLRYSPDLAAIQDISKNIDQVTDIVESLKQKTTPVGSIDLPSSSALPSTRLAVPEAPLRVQKSTRPKLRSLIEGNLGIQAEVARPAESLYKRRFEALKVPVVKESKPQRETRSYKSVFPILRKA